MLIAKVFLPFASPGLASLGFGMIAVANGTTNIVQVAAIIGGLAVVAVAGIFTIRSNVAKIWREERDGEKARADKLQGELRDLIASATQTAEGLKVEWAAEVAQMKIDWAAEVSEKLHDVTLEREAKERALADLDTANARTDMAPVLAALEKISRTLADR